MQAEPDILVTAGSDRGIALYDLRSGAHSQSACVSCMLMGESLLSPSIPFGNYFTL